MAASTTTETHRISVDDYILPRRTWADGSDRVLKLLRDDKIASLEKNCLTIHDLERLHQLAGREVESSNSDRPERQAKLDHMCA